MGSEMYGGIIHMSKGGSGGIVCMGEVVGKAEVASRHKTTDMAGGRVGRVHLTVRHWSEK